MRDKELSLLWLQRRMKTFSGDGEGDVCASTDRHTLATTKLSFDHRQLWAVFDFTPPDAELTVHVTSRRIHTTCPAPKHLHCLMLHKKSGCYWKPSVTGNNRTKIDNCTCITPTSANNNWQTKDRRITATISRNN